MISKVGRWHEGFLITSIKPLTNIENGAQLIQEMMHRTGHISLVSNSLIVNSIYTMLLEQIKGFYHGITKIFLLVGSISKDVYVVVHMRADCGIFRLHHL